jgi:hypothetical protein
MVGGVKKKLSQLYKSVRGSSDAGGPAATPAVGAEGSSGAGVQQPTGRRVKRIVTSGGRGGGRSQVDLEESEEEEERRGATPLPSADSGDEEFADEDEETADLAAGSQGGTSSSTSSGVYSRGPSGLPPRPSAPLRRPLIRPVGEK